MPAYPHFHLVFGVHDLQLDKRETTNPKTNITKTEISIVDPRFKGNNTEFLNKKIPYPKKTKNKKDEDEVLSYGFKSAVENKTFGDTIFWRENVFGIHIDEVVYGYNFMMALSTLHTEYQQKGYKIIPSTPLSEDITPQGEQLRKIINHSKRRRKPGLQYSKVKPFAREANYKKRLIKYGWNYAQFGIAIDHYVMMFSYVTKHAGFSFSWNDVKLLLYHEQVPHGPIDKTLYMDV